jgi:hypothetical protein
LEQLEPFHDTDEVCRASIGLDAVGVSSNKTPGFILFDWFRGVVKKENALVIVYIL